MATYIEREYSASNYFDEKIKYRFITNDIELYKIVANVIHKYKLDKRKKDIEDKNLKILLSDNIDIDDEIENSVYIPRILDELEVEEYD